MHYYSVTKVLKSMFRPINSITIKFKLAITNVII